MKRRELKISWSVRDCETPQTHDHYRALPVRDPRDLVGYLSPLAAEVQEVAWVVFLDARMKIAGYREVGRGSLTSCSLDARQVYTAALLSHCAAVILAHNHPSGDPTPSEQDIEVTRLLSKGLDTLEIPLLDPVVVALAPHGAVRHCSFKNIGKMD